MSFISSADNDAPGTSYGLRNLFTEIAAARQSVNGIWLKAESLASRSCAFACRDCRDALIDALCLYN